MEQKETLTPEELKAEKEALEEVKEDEVKEKVISDFGLDADIDSELIDKIVKERVDFRKDLSQTIGQKIKYRTERDQERLKSQPPPASDTKKDLEPEELDKKLDEKLTQQLEKRDLDALDYPIELKTEIQKVAKLQNISIKQAVSDPYIAFKIEAYEGEKETEEASTSRTNKKGSKTEYSLDNAPEVDMNTEEGRKKWDDYKEKMRKQHPTSSL